MRALIVGDSGLVGKHLQRLCYQDQHQHQHQITIAFISVGSGINNIMHAKDIASAIILYFERKRGAPFEEYIINGELISYRYWFSAIENQIGISERFRLQIFLAPICK